MSAAVAYHWLLPDPDHGAPVLCPEGFKAADFQKGAWLKRDFAGIGRFSVGGPWPPAHWLGQRVPLVSELLLNTLARAGANNFQAFSARLEHQGTAAECSGYFAFNVLGLVDAVDPEVSGPASLVLAGPRTMGLPMFRLASNQEMLLVHDRVMRALWAHAPERGWGFSPVEIPVRA